MCNTGDIMLNPIEKFKVSMGITDMLLGLGSY